MDTLEVVRIYRQEDSWNLFAVEPLDWFIDHAKQSTHTGLAGW